MYISPITIGEIEAGIEDNPKMKEQKKQNLRVFLSQANLLRMQRETGQIYGLTAIGRVTVEELGMNESLVVNTRLKLIEFDLI